MTQASAIPAMSSPTRSQGVDSAADIGTQAVLIGLDWGTTSLRSYVFDAAGRVLACETLPWGIMRLPQAEIGPEQEAVAELGADSDAASAHTRAASVADTALELRRAAFEFAFDAACSAWLSVQPDLPVIACGMVGSAQGWVEVPYVEGQVDAAVLAQAIVSLVTRSGKHLHIVPGVLERGTLPNVMRGEETQIVGVSLSHCHRVASGSASALAISPLLIGLPGTHAKWVLSSDGRIGHFDTFMTGEVFAILRDHSILGRTMTPSGSDTDSIDPSLANAAFLHGIAVARSQSEISLLATIFSVRTMGLTGQLEAGQQSDYLSGLLIGSELTSLDNSLSRHDGVPLRERSIVLSGEAGLCERYRTALVAWGCTAVSFAGDATERGLWHIAAHASLITAAGSDSVGARGVDDLHTAGSTDLSIPHSEHAR